MNLTAPTDGTTVGGLVQLTAQASDNAAVDRVEFLVNGVRKGVDINAPYSVSWDSKEVPDAGTAEIVAKAFDAANNQTTSATHTVTVDNKPPTDGTVAINGGVAITKSAAVKLALSASDLAPDSGVAAMRFSNDAGATWSGWEPYATSKSWTLSGGDGTKTVHVQYRDAIGNVSVPARDSITLDTLKPTISGMSPRHQSIITNTRPTIKATVKDKNGLTKANKKLYVNADLIAPRKYTYDPNTGALVYNSPALAPGRKTVKIVATDLAKNIGTKS